MMCRLLLAWLLAVPAAAAPAAASRGHYVDVQDIVAEFPGEPSLDSEADAADLAAVKEWQAKRTPAECARARSEETPSFDNLFGTVSPFPKPPPARAARLFQRAAADSGKAVGFLKARSKRARPFLRDSSIVPCVSNPSGNAYPSGHATLGRLYGLVLADLVPERRSEFLARGAEIALDRVIGGVHHPSDVEAGARLGDALHARMRESAVYRADLAAARAELPAP